MIEIIATSLEDALLIETCGAHRIELVSRMDLDGLSPDIHLVKAVVDRVNIPVNVMVRFDHTTFNYSEDEIKSLYDYIKEIDNIPINGLVLGATIEGKVNLHLVKEVLKLTRKPVTFHRAIDTVDEIEVGYQSLIPYVSQILTSGGRGHATDNLTCLERLYNLSEETLLIGSGVSIHNLKELMEKFPKANFHIGSDVRLDHMFNRPIDEVRLIKLMSLYNEHLI